jgi:phospholipid/cholesterol/gamma-HCH transport system ATP-binding protein
MAAPTTRDESAPVIEVRGLETRFGERVVHEGVDLDVRRGEVFAIIGGSGSGKSTLLRELIMLQRPTAGSIRLLGAELDGLREEQRLSLRRRLGVLFQGGALFSELTVLENVAFGLREHTGLSAPFVDELAALKLHLAGLGADAHTLFPSQLSGGMRKRTALARAIAMDPELLFLDEPTSGLDPASADAFDDLVTHLRDDLGLTIIIITHDMDTVWTAADRVLVLGQGRALGLGTPDDLARRDDPALAEFFRGARGGRAAEDAGGSRSGDEGERGTP